MVDFTQLTLAVRAAGDPEALITSVKSQVWSVDKNLPVFEVRTMEQILDGDTSQRKFQSFVMSIFAGLALVLALTTPTNMKMILTAILTFACLTSAFAQQRLVPTNWRKVQIYDVPALLEQEVALLGQRVAVRFNYRSEKLRNLQPDWSEASVWQRDPKAKSGFSALRVMVAKKDLPAFQSITSDFRSAKQITVYGRIEKDPFYGPFVYLRLLGRKIVTGPLGNDTVDW